MAGWEHDEDPGARTAPRGAAADVGAAVEAALGRDLLYPPA
jgi:hypothetical protein